ncbi:MAG TPA: hypothetical protein VFZ65_00030 [Planctomycetota bacterium]|nr:hypothetical protein [Planctomycetota bacterium]
MADVLRADRANALVLAGGPRELRCLGLLRDVARIAAVLPAPRSGSHIAFAFDHDRRAFLAALLATWHRGHAVALPSSARLRAVGPVLAQPEVLLLAHDTGAGTGLHVPSLLAADDEDRDGDAPGDDVALVGPLTLHWPRPDGSLRTRHVTAADLRARLHRCIDELRLPAGAALQNVFGPAFPPALLPGLLAPLGAGATVLGDDEPRAAGSGPFAAHTLLAPASRLRDLARGEVELGALRQVVTVATELDATTVARLRERRIAVGTTTPLEALDPRRTALEHALLDTGDARDAAVAIVDGPGQARAFAAVVAKTVDAAAGPRLSALVPGTSFELFALPELVRDRDGQIDDETLLLRLGRAADGSVPCRSLQFETVGGPAGTARFRTRVPHDFFAFAGHFPTYPVLSGAAQLHELVLPCLRLALGDGIVTTAFHDLKFLSRIGPGDTVEIAVSSPNGAVVDFEILRDGVRCSSGRVTLLEEVPAP